MTLLEIQSFLDIVTPSVSRQKVTISRKVTISVIFMMLDKKSVSSKKSLFQGESLFRGTLYQRMTVVYRGTTVPTFEVIF